MHLMKRPIFTLAQAHEAVEALRCRLFDNPALVAFGPLSTDTQADLHAIVACSPMYALGPYERWMVKSNLEHVRSEGVASVAAQLRANGYPSIAAAVEAESVTP